MASPSSVILDADLPENFEASEEEVHEYARWLGMDPETEGELLWIARQGIKAPLPPDWKPCKSTSGDIYYFNFRTGESRWDHPQDDHYKTLYEEEKQKRNAKISPKLQPESPEKDKISISQQLEAEMEAHAKVELEKKKKAIDEQAEEELAARRQEVEKQVSAEVQARKRELEAQGEQELQVLEGRLREEREVRVEAAAAQIKAEEEQQLAALRAESAAAVQALQTLRAEEEEALARARGEVRAAREEAEGREGAQRAWDTRLRQAGWVSVAAVTLAVAVVAGGRVARAQQGA